MKAPTRPATLENLLHRLVNGERAALARAISIVENGKPEQVAAIRRGLAAHLGTAQVIGVTGAPGAGKSTLINALIGELLQRGGKVGVVAVDPSSPLTGGAILGDRIRMGEHGAHENVFIRSLSARGHLGGLSKSTAAVVDLLDAGGFDAIIVETVGTGQSEVEITKVADTRLVVCSPGLGDDIQALKAGILEIADILVVNKADHPLAENTARDLKEMLNLRRQATSAWQVPVLLTTATTKKGIPELVDAIARHNACIDRRTRLAHRTPGDASLGDADQALQRLFDSDPFVKSLGIERLVCRPGECVARLAIRDQHLNFSGNCHGGVLFSLADTVFGVAAAAHGYLAPGIDTHMTFQVAVRHGDVLTATATEVSRSKKLGVYRVDIQREDRTIVASFTGTVYITGKKLAHE